jgi:CRISPR-associated protein Cmr6
MARREVVAHAVLQPDATTNLGLWLDRYSPGFDQEVLRQHHGSCVERVRVPAGYAAALQRRKALLRAYTGDFDGGETRLYDLTFAGRAVVGIGAASVRETNLSMLRPWGLPYVSGSALKGLASHTAHGVGPWARPATPGEDAGVLQRALFGDVKSAGAVVFHDAWYVPTGDKVPVACDTMTVHHAKYYQGAAAPCDWDEPNPVSFLTMHGTYLAALTGPGEALDLVEEILRRGTREGGVGAKTAAGYGRASFERHFSELSRLLRGFERPAAAANNVQSQAQELLGFARKARFPDEVQAARDAARRMIDASPKVWRSWVAQPARSDEERLWFRGEVAIPVAPPVEVARRAAEASAPTSETRRVRVLYVPDKKAAKRYALNIDGKEYKGHLVALPEGALEQLRAAGAEGIELAIEFEDGKPRRKTEPS